MATYSSVDLVVVGAGTYFCSLTELSILGTNWRESVHIGFDMIPG